MGLISYDPQSGTLEVRGRTLRVSLGENPPPLVLEYVRANPEASESEIQNFAVRYFEDRINQLERLLKREE